MTKKWVYLFNEVELAEDYVGGEWDAVRGLLGGKGANLAEMVRLEVPVPPGFTLTTVILTKVRNFRRICGSRSWMH
jgi:pyruvate,orthophosphate dikinase